MAHPFSPPAHAEVDHSGDGSTPAAFPLWIALIALAIFTGPNLIVLFTGSLGELAEQSASDGSLGLVQTLATLVLQLAIFGLALVPLALSRTPLKVAVGSARRSVLFTGVGLVLGVAITVIVLVFNALLIGTFGQSTPVEQSLLPSPSDSLGVVLVLAVLVIVVAPITEELLFRGVLFASLRRKIGMHPAALLSGAVFAMVHVEVLASQPLALGGLTLAGVLLAYAFHYTKSLHVAIVMHAVYNGTAFGVMLLLSELEGLGLPV
ncbi:MAG: type II CAAX endopeptidase family protein [Nitriliruptoraceae bacterium]